MQTNRFGPESYFSGMLIDRSRPLSFRFNQRLFYGYEGDSLFTALRANGVSEVAVGASKRLAFDRDTAHKICVKPAKVKSAAVPMDVLAVTDGMELEQVHAPTLVQKVLQRFGLGKNVLPVNGVTDKALDISTSHPANRASCDVAVIGGGIAGMQAAINAANRGEKVVLLESTNRLGGMSDYYGKAEDDQDPVELINVLSEQIKNHSSIRVFIAHMAVDVRGNVVEVECMGPREDAISQLEFKKLVVASGAVYSRAFSSGQEPAGLLKAVDTFRLAMDYGIKPNDPLNVFSGGNSGYRLAYLLSEAGLTVENIWDPRVGASSRHIDFAKAIGLKIQQGRFAQQFERKGGKLQAIIQSPFDRVGQRLQHAFNHVIVSDAPIPNTILWSRAGGRVAFDEGRQAFYPIGSAKDLEIVGSAAGAITQAECLMQANSLFNNRSSAEGKLGQYKYEDPASTLGFDKRDGFIAEVRAKANVPHFVGLPAQNASTEYVFNNHRPARQLPSSHADEKVVQSPLSADIESFFFNMSKSRFSSPKCHELAPDQAGKMNEGQVIFDGDGIASAAVEIGIVTRANGILVGVFKANKVQENNRVFFQTRNGLRGCTIGKLIASV